MSNADVMTVPINASITFRKGQLTVLFPDKLKDGKITYEKISMLEVCDHMRDTLLQYKSSSTVTIYGHGTYL